MNEQAMEKPKMDPKYIASLTVRLGVTCVVVACLLGLVNMVTLPRITAAKQAATAAAMSAVVTGEGLVFDEAEVTDDLTEAASAQGGQLSELYSITQDGAGAGYVMKVSTSGSQGTIVMMVGVDAADAVTGVAIVENSETPGIGSRVMGNEATASGTPVLDQFIGKSPADGTLTVGGNIDAISGATVSSRGVTAGVNAVLAAADILD